MNIMTFQEIILVHFKFFISSTITVGCPYSSRWWYPYPYHVLRPNVFYLEALIFVGAMIYLVAKFLLFLRIFLRKKTPENTLFGVIVFFPVRIHHFCKIQTLKEQKKKETLSRGLKFHEKSLTPFTFKRFILF